MKPGPYVVALGREINADLDLYDVLLLPSTGEPTADLPAPPSPYDDPIRRLWERHRMREAPLPVLSLLLGRQRVRPPSRSVVEAVEPAIGAH